MPPRKKPNLVASVRKTVSNMHWLTPADQAAVDLALRYAHQIEEAEFATSDHERTKMLGWLGPNLLATLKALGGTPAERKALDIQIKAVDELSKLRDDRRRLTS